MNYLTSASSATLHAVPNVASLVRLSFPFVEEVTQSKALNDYDERKDILLSLIDRYARSAKLPNGLKVLSVSRQTGDKSLGEVYLSLPHDKVAGALTPAGTLLDDEGELAYAALAVLKTPTSPFEAVIFDSPIDKVVELSRSNRTRTLAVTGSKVTDYHQRAIQGILDYASPWGTVERLSTPAPTVLSEMYGGPTDNQFLSLLNRFASTTTPSSLKGV